MLTYAFFLSNCRESLIHAFRKKDPLSVQGGGAQWAKGGTESVHRKVTFFPDGFPNRWFFRQIKRYDNPPNISLLI